MKGESSHHLVETAIHSSWRTVVVLPQMARREMVAIGDAKAIFPWWSKKTKWYSEIFAVGTVFLNIDPALALKIF